MLKRFSVKNYKNFKDEIVLDLGNVRDYKFNADCVISSPKLLGKMIMMGTNGSGKTNFGYALFDIVMQLTDNSTAIQQRDESSFLNCNSSEKYATFKYDFIFENDNVAFEYHKISPTKTVYEKLCINGEIIYEFNIDQSTRDFKNINKINAADLNLTQYRGEISLLRFIINNTIQDETSLIRKVSNYVNHMLYFRSVQDGNTYIGFMNGGELIGDYILENNLISDFQSFLKEMANLDIKLSRVKNKGMKDTFVQDFGEKKLVFDSVASSGTKAVELFYYWKRKFDQVSFLFIDEFDAYYHYEMSERLLHYLISEFPDLQVLLTSYNTALMNNKIMRPDCYLIIKDNNIRHLSDSADREIREGHNLEKMFRNGEFDE